MGHTIRIHESNFDLSSKNVVVLGANGSGKTTVGHSIAQAGAERITARRGLDVPETIGMAALASLDGEIQSIKKNVTKQRNLFLSDFDLVFRRIMADATERAHDIRREIENGRTTFSKTDAKTKLTEVTEVWTFLFPGRELRFDDHKPVVVNSSGGTASTYKQSEMSDGERQALYLALKIALMPDDCVIVIDEPEIHLHSELARRLWDRFELWKQKCRFVYITHDLSFAISRRNSYFVVLRGASQLLKFDDLSELPDEVVREIIGGASASIKGTKIVFCEGNRQSIDGPLLEAWFCSNATDVIPAGSCDNVQQCVKAFSAAELIKGCTVAGVVDRDERCEEEIEFLKSQGLFVLPVAEIEHLFALTGVILAVGNILKKEEEELRRKCEELSGKLKRAFSSRLHIQTLRTSKDRIRWTLNFPIGKVDVPSQGNDPTLVPGCDSTSAADPLMSLLDLTVKVTQVDSPFQSVALSPE